MPFPSESDMMSKELQNSDLLHVNLIAFYALCGNDITIL